MTLSIIARLAVLAIAAMTLAFPAAAQAGAKQDIADIRIPLGGECWAGVPPEPRRAEEAQAFIELMLDFELCTLDVMAELAEAYNRLNEIAGGNGRMQIVQYDIYYVPSKKPVPEEIREDYALALKRIEAGIAEAKRMMAMFRDYIAIGEAVANEGMLPEIEEETP